MVVLRGLAAVRAALFLVSVVPVGLLLGLDSICPSWVYSTLLLPRNLTGAMLVFLLLWPLIVTVCTMTSWAFWLEAAEALLITEQRPHGSMVTTTHFETLPHPPSIAPQPQVPKFYLVRYFYHHNRQVYSRVFAEPSRPQRQRIRLHVHAQFPQIAIKDPNVKYQNLARAAVMFAVTTILWLFLIRIHAQMVPTGVWRFGMTLTGVITVCSQVNWSGNVAMKLSRERHYRIIQLLLLG